MDQRAGPAAARVAGGAPDCQMFAVHMDDGERSAAFMQIIDILRDERDGAAGNLLRPFALEPPQRVVRGVGRLGLDRLAPHVIEAQHKVWIAREAFGRGDILDAVLLPQAPGRAEGIYPAFGGNPGSCQDDDVANGLHRGHEAQQ